MRKLNLYKLVNAVTFSLIVGMIVLFLCPILILTHATSPTETNESLALHIVSFFVKSRILNCIELLLSIYILSISICFLIEYRFTVIGFVFTLLLNILMTASSIVKLGVVEYEKRRLKAK